MPPHSFQLSEGLSIMINEEKLIRILKILENTAIRLSEISGIRLDSFDIQIAAVRYYELDDSISLLELDITEDVLVDDLANFDFQMLRPKIIGEIILFDDLFPKNIIRLIEEQIIKEKGNKWFVHKNDADPFPSNPHAHNYEKGWTLDLGTGKLYIRRDEVGQISKKNFLKIRKLLEKKQIALPTLNM
jgi:hypothetical protein